MNMIYILLQFGKQTLTVMSIFFISKLLIIISNDNSLFFKWYWIQITSKYFFPIFTNSKSNKM